MKTHDNLKPITVDKFNRFNQLQNEHDPEWMSYHRRKHAQQIGMSMLDFETIRVNYNELKEKFEG